MQTQRTRRERESGSPCLNCGAGNAFWRDLLCSACADSLGQGVSHIGGLIARINAGHFGGCTMSITPYGEPDRWCDCGLDEAWLELYRTFTMRQLESDGV